MDPVHLVGDLLDPLNLMGDLLDPLTLLWDLHELLKLVRVLRDSLNIKRDLVSCKPWKKSPVSTEHCERSPGSNEPSRRSPGSTKHCDSILLSLRDLLDPVNYKSSPLYPVNPKVVLIHSTFLEISSFLIILNAVLDLVHLLLKPTDPWKFPCIP